MSAGVRGSQHRIAETGKGGEGEGMGGEAGAGGGAGGCGRFKRMVYDGEAVGGDWLLALRGYVGRWLDNGRESSRERRTYGPRND